MQKLESVAFIHHNASAGKSLVRMAQSAALQTRLYPSVDGFLTDASRSELDCVVLDASIPDERAFELLKLLHETESPTPVILISRTDEPELRQRAYELGAAGFFHEPVDGEALLDAMRWSLCKVNEPNDTGSST